MIGRKTLLAALLGLTLLAVACNSVGGKAVGGLFGNAVGKAREVEGNFQKLIGKAEDKVRDAVEKGKEQVR